MAKQQLQGLSIELQVAAICTKRGWRISLPYQQACPYDLVVEKDGKLYKVQVKKNIPCTKFAQTHYGWAFKMKCRHTKKQKRYDRREVDAFATIYQDKGYMYFLGEKEKPPRSLPIKIADLPEYQI